eukprot:11158820-Lingulodinium_polyedra.AAC.1
MHFAYEPGLSTSRAVGVLQFMFARRYEWRRSQSIFILDADVVVVFGNLGPDEVVGSLDLLAIALCITYVVLSY